MRGVPERLTPEMLRRFRLSLNCTQEEIATLLGIRSVTWGRWERGEEGPAHPPMLLYALEYLTFQHYLKTPLGEARHSAATRLETEYWNEKTRRRVRHPRQVLQEVADLDKNPIV